jgi:serine/threonine protein phosphatase PrpC
VIGFDNIDYASLTDVGVRRSHNQDAYATLPAGDAEQWQGRGHVFLVADGMGAHAVGELASKLAADTIPHVYTKHAHEGAAAALRKAFIETNLTIHTRGQQNREFEGMGTTATVVLLRPEGAWVGHVGDSRCYRIRAGKIEQLSFDHSLVWELARRQRRDPDELQGIPSNVIIRSLGPEPLVQVDVEGPHPIQPGDIFVLCSDGLSGPVSDPEIGAVVSVLPPAEACKFLIHLANLQGGPDNITALVARVGEPDPGSNARPSEGAQPFRADLHPFKTPVSNVFRRIPWPFTALFLGIVFSIAALALTYYSLPGGIPTFLFAAVALISGLVGLMILNAQEKKRTALEAENPPRTHIYRQADCKVDEAVLQKASHAVANLEEQIRERHWQADWDASRHHLQLSDQARAVGDLPQAYREQCRAMQILMEAVQRQRAKEEVFRPLWDKVPE